LDCIQAAVKESKDQQARLIARFEKGFTALCLSIVP